MPLAAFRRPTINEHVALIEHIRRQLGAFEEACGGLDPEETLRSGRSGRLLSDALERWRHGPAIPPRRVERVQYWGKGHGLAAMCNYATCCEPPCFSKLLNLRSQNKN